VTTGDWVKAACAGIAVGIVAFFAVAAVLRCSAIHVPQQRDQQGDKSAPAETKAVTNQEDSSESFWRRTTNDPVSLYTGVLALLTAILVIVAIVQIRFLIRADDTSTIAANAALASANAAISAQRPWVPVQIVVDGPITLTDAGMVINLSALIENIGATPTSQVHVLAKAYLNYYGHRDATAEHKTLCANIKNQQFILGDSLFPGEKRTIKLDGAWIPWAEIQKSIDPVDWTHDMRLVYPVIIGCVDYVFGNPPEHHQTPFSFAIFDAHGQNGMFPVSVSPDQGGVTKENVLLMKLKTFAAD